MKLTIERSALLASLQHVQSVVERRNTIPILSNVELSAEGAELRLTATDMDIWVYDKTPADVGASGSITASAHMLFDIVRKLSDDSKVELELGKVEGQLSLKSGQTLFSLSSLPVEDFPSVSEGDWGASFRCLPRRFASLLIERVLRCRQRRPAITLTAFFCIQRQALRITLSGRWPRMDIG